MTVVAHPLTLEIGLMDFTSFFYDSSPFKKIYYLSEGATS